MPAKAGTSSRNIAAEIAFLTRALKAPSLANSVERLAERARAESWTHEEFLAACPGARWRAPAISRHARSRPVNHTAVKAGSGPPGSRLAKAWRSSTTTTDAH